MERALVAGLAEGERRGRLSTIAAIIEATAAALIGAHYAEVASQVLSGGIRGASEALRLASESSWRAAWAAGFRGVFQEVMNAAELPTNKGTYRPPFDTSRPGFAEFLDDYTYRFAEQVNSTSRDAIAEVLREAQAGGYSVEKTAQRLEEEAADVSRTRAKTIARTELNNAARAGAFAKARLSGVVAGKTWMHSLQPNPREEHLAQDGVTVGIDERFPDGSLYPDAINCRCTLRFEIADEVLGERSA